MGGPPFGNHIVEPVSPVPSTEAVLFFCLLDLSCSVAPFFPFFFWGGGAPLKWSSQKRVPFFFPGSLNN